MEIFNDIEVVFYAFIVNSMLHIIDGGKHMMKISLRKQMIYSFSAVFILLMIVFGFLVSKYNIAMYQKQSYEYNLKIVKSNISLIDNYFEQIRNVSKIVANDPDIIKAVSYRNSVDEVDYSIELYNQRSVVSKIKQLDVLGDITNAVIIGDNNQYQYYYGSSPVRGYNYGDQDWFTNSTITSDRYVRFTNFHSTDYLLNAKEIRTVSIITPIISANPYNIHKRAFLLVDFNLDPIIIDNHENGNTQIAIYDGSNPVYFAQGSWLSEDQKEEISQALADNKGSFILNGNKENKISYLVVNETSPISGWSILGIMPLTEIEQMRATSTSFVIIAIVIACILVVLLSYGISRSILIPMNSLIAKFNEIAQGNRKVEFKQTKSIEIDTIASTAEHMLNNMNHLTDEVVAEQKKLAHEQLKVLQHQTNPHFLNNVLQSIKAMAVTGDVESISRATTLLGKIFSYSVYNPYDQVTIENELTYTENYIALQNIRFNNLITYTVSCDESIRHFLIPKLMIQPLVENAIEHGLSNHKEGHLMIIVEDADDEIYIAVTNTGSVIDPQKVADLNNMLSNQDTYKQSKSIGLLNLNQRLKSCFGPQAGMKIFSREGMSTSIVITIPKERE